MKYVQTTITFYDGQLKWLRERAEYECSNVSQVIRRMVKEKMKESGEDM